jgi:hypothetical protein
LLSLLVVAFDGIRVLQMAPWGARIYVFAKYFYDAMHAEETRDGTETHELDLAIYNHYGLFQKASKRSHNQASITLRH